MCYLCLRLMVANHTDPVTGAFTGLELRLGGAATEKGTTPIAEPSPVLLQRESESVAARKENPNTSANGYETGTATFLGDS